jgi:transcriptional regulator with XRE-family HTH domain
MNDFYRVGEKLISMEKVVRLLGELLDMRSRGYSQQEAAERFGLDRSFVSRLEGLGAVRKGMRLAVIGFPIENKEEILQLLNELGVDFQLIMTNRERWQFVEQKSGIDLFNEVMQITTRVRSYDAVILVGSRQRIKWSAALLDKEVVGIELGESPLTEDQYLDPQHLKLLIQSLR